MRFQAGEERHVLSAGGTLVLEGNVPYEAEALSDAAFLHTLSCAAGRGGQELAAISAPDGARGRAPGS